MFNILMTILLMNVVYSTSDIVTIVTAKGAIIGYKKNGYNTFFGVPYGIVNEDNPFGNYLIHPNFKTPFIANDSSIICPQVFHKIGGILQCLRLNIYVPHTANPNHTLPILVWFYGGGFVFGAAGSYGGQHLAKHDIIVITVNYRLGPYGFLCLNDRTVPGNQGLKDQIGALRWIKKHIEVFGGDPSKVTIAGESYGGGAVDLHLYSKYDKLFDKAIIQSGSMHTPGFFSRRNYDAAMKLAAHLGHNMFIAEKDPLKALATENPMNVMAAAKNLSLKLTVCKEKRYKGIQNFVTKCRLHLKNREKIENTPIMIGYNSKEDFGTYANKTRDFYYSLGDIFQRNLQTNYILQKCELDSLSNITRKFYLGGKKIGPESKLELSDYSSDFKLNYAVERSVNRFIEQDAIVYKYLFSYIGGSIYQNVSGAGAVHTEELKYLFETNSKLKTDEQKMIRNRMTKMWANFVKFGNPTPKKTTLLPVQWVPVTGSERPYLNIDVKMEMMDHVYKHRIAFWDLFMQKYDNISMCKI